jgi:hypothetical protein
VDTPATCIAKVPRMRLEHHILGDLVAGDAGSANGTPRVAHARAWLLLTVTKGYGAAHGRFIISS